MLAARSTGAERRPRRTVSWSGSCETFGDEPGPRRGLSHHLPRAGAVPVPQGVGRGARGGPGPGGLCARRGTQTGQREGVALHRGREHGAGRRPARGAGAPPPHAPQGRAADERERRRRCAARGERTHPRPRRAGAVVAPRPGGPVAVGRRYLVRRDRRTDRARARGARDHAGPVPWAATVLLALGIGTYLGSWSAASRQRVVTDQAGPVPAADSVAPARGLAEFSLDSARALLGREPVVLPGAPIRALRRAHLPGYAAAVVIEQQLDSGTVVQLVERRRAEMRMDAVVAERVAAPSAAAERTRAPQAAARAAAQAPAPIRPVRLGVELEVTVSGPLPSDSPTRLLRHVAPLKAQSVTGP